MLHTCPPCCAIALNDEVLHPAHAGRTFQSMAGQAACAPCPKGGTLSADHRGCSESAQQITALATDRPLQTAGSLTMTPLIDKMSKIIVSSMNMDLAV